MKKVRLYICLLLPLLVTSRLFAQIEYGNIRFKQLNIEHGLSHNNVNAIAQDSRGFMWFGTGNGLSRYDGYTVKRYNHNDKSSINHDFIRELYSDTYRNVLWIATDDGLSMYDPKRDSFVNFPLGERYNAKFLNTFTNKLIVGSRDGVFVYSDTTRSFEPYILHQKDANITSVVDSGELIYVTGPNGVVCYNIVSEKFQPLPKPIRHLESNCQSVTKLRDDNLLFITPQIITIYNTKSGLIRECRNVLYKKIIRSTTVDKTNNIWFGTEYGVYVYNQNLNQVAYYSQTADDFSGLSDTPIYTIFCDKNYNIWLGTYFGGVNYFINSANNFRVYSFGYNQESLSGKAVRQMISAPDGGVYISTEDGGLNYLSRDREVVRSAEIEKKVKINGKNIHSLFIDKNNNLWIGHFLKGVNVHNFESGRNVVINTNTSNFCMTELGDGSILYGGPNGVFEVKAGSYKTKQVTNIPTFDILKLNDTVALIGTRASGVLKLNLITKQVESIDTLSYTNQYITYLYRDTKERIWVGTNNNGLYVIDSEFNIIKQYSNSSLGSNAIKSIVEDDYGVMWCGTNHGLVSIDFEREHVGKYCVLDGLPTNQFNYSSVCKREDGELLFGTINGLVSFYPEQIKSTQEEFNVVLTQIWSNNLLLSPQSESALAVCATELDDITFTYDQARSLSFEYSGLNYLYKNHTQYAMKVDGLDKEWVNVGNQHQVRFANLSPGKYTLRIKASSNGVSWDEDGMKELYITVLAPWWQTNWAIVCYVLIGVLIAYMLYCYTKSRLDLQMKLKAEYAERANIESLNNQKINFFTYVSHDLKTPLTLILSPLQSLINKGVDSSDIDKIKGIYRNAYKMDFLIDELLTFSKIEMKQMKINVRKGDIIRFVDELVQQFFDVAESKEIDFVIDIPEESSEVWFSASKLERILYNLLSNAFKYTPAGGYVRLSVCIEQIDTEEFICVIVEDNGRGIPLESQSKIFENYYQVDKKDHRAGFGLGLSLTKLLVQMHKGKIELSSKVGIGSEFRVWLNVSESAYDVSERSMEMIEFDGAKKYNARLHDKIELVSEQLITPNTDGMQECILVVEDNLEMNNYVYEIFSQNYNVRRAYNGAQAMAIVEQYTVALIISDVMMPVMDGLEFTQKIKQDINYSHIPMILLTAKTSDSDARSGYEYGADGYIAKPFDAQNLELLVRNTLQLKARNIEHFKQSSELNIKMIVNNPRDEQFINRLLELIKENITDETFGVSEIVKQMGVSRSLLHIKLKSLTECSLTQFIRSVKMKEAKKYLLEGKNVSESSYLVGMSNPNYFTKCFRKEFNVTPTEFIKNISIKE